MENAIYWKGKQVGIEVSGKILWFTGTPQEAIECLQINRNNKWLQY